MRENGELKASGGKHQTRGGESEQEESELSEDIQLVSGDSSNSCIKTKKTVTKSSTENDTQMGEKWTKQETMLMRDLGKEDRSRDSEVMVQEEEGKKMASGDVTGDLELSDEEDATPTKAAALEDASETKGNRSVVKKGTEEEALESGTKPQSDGEGNGKMVADAGGGETKEVGEDNLVEVEDGDDYLMYLEEILKTVHKAFYDLYDELNGDVPDLKSVIPYVRRKVLAGTSLVFSGLVPTHTPLEKSRAYLVARSMGAQVTQDLTPETTHLVAVRPGTAKVNAARRVARNVIIVTPDWLWCCGERWEKVDER